MAHIRQQLRTKAKAVVEGAGITAFVNRDKQISQTELPCAVITTDKDRVEPFINSGNRAGCGNNKTNRIIDLVIRVYAQSYQNVDNALDDLCVDIENAFAEDITIKTAYLDLESTSIDIFGEGDQPIAVATLKYIAEFKNITDPEQVVTDPEEVIVEP